MDFRDQDGNSESLFGARNENSVLFSIDDLQSNDGDMNSSGANPSGDASGLINLSTLSAMSQSEGGQGENGDSFGMQSMVFNSVVPKKARNWFIAVIIIAVVLVLVVAGVGGYLWYSSYQNQQKVLTDLVEENKKQQEEANKAKQDAADVLNTKLNEQKAKFDAEKAALIEKNEKNAEALRLAEQQRQTQEALEANKAPSKPAGGGSGSAKKPTPGPGAEAVASGKATSKPPSSAEVKKALESCQKKATKCAKNGTLTVQMSINSAGSAKNVKAVGGTFQGSASEKCILTVVEKHQFPTFTGAAIPVKYTFKL